MTDKRILTPGPNHPITIEPTKGRVVVTVAGRAVADSHSALTLREASYPAVQYIARADVHMSLLERNGTSSYCPYKGEAAYFRIEVGGVGGQMPAGLMRAPTRRSQRSTNIWPSTLIASTPSTSST